MSIMELDPPDYWLVLDPRGDPVRHPVSRAWMVAPLGLPGGGQVLLVRIDPPYFVYGRGDEDFVVLRPMQPGVLLDPVQVGSTPVELCAYLGQYRGQVHVSDEDLRLVRELVALAGEDHARRVIDHLNQHGYLPR